MRWLEDNPVGQVLAAVAGGLVAIMLVLGVVWSLSPEGAGVDGNNRDEPLQVEVPRMPDSAPIESFAVVTDRPVFNESRQPELELDTGDEEGGEGAEDLAQEMVDAPELELAGVVITPSLRMVTLRPKKARESLVAFEGQPLRGDYGSWHVSRIEPREITLASGDEREMQLQLQIHDAKIAPPPAPRPAEVAAEQQPAAADTEGERPLTRAEEIRQRIAERREQLRRANLERNDEEKPMTDYQRSVQSMIGARSKPKESDDE